MNEAAAAGGTLRERVAAIPQWYHTLQLAPGVRTPGWFDLRDVPDQLPGLAAVAGRRCLDVGTFDGFWAFEMERRGAAEVVAIDVLEPTEWDWPVEHLPETVEAVGLRKMQGAGFVLAHEALGSRVRRVERSVYDLSVEEFGEFDFVYVGSLLLHLRDPILALQRVRSVCRGELLVVDAVDYSLSRLLPKVPVATLDGRGRPWWWKPNLAGLARMVTAAGFEIRTGPRLIYMPPGAGQPTRRPPLRRLVSRAGVDAAFTHYRGEPHAAVLAVRSGS